MATYRVKSGAAGAADGSTWADAYTTLSAALSGKAATDVIWVAHDHAETQASAMTLTLPNAWGIQILCVTTDGASGNSGLATTATVTTTGASAMSFLGYGYFYGITFNCATSGTLNLHVHSNNGTPGFIYMEACKLGMLSNGAGARIVFGNPGNPGVAQRAMLVNTTMRFGNTGQGINPIDLIWRSTASAIDTGGSTPSTLFLPTAAPLRRAVLTGVDLSAITGTLVAVSTTVNEFEFRNCKLGAGVALKSGSFAGPQSGRVTLIRCDSADTNYRFQESSYAGDIYSETTIVRTGGASDGTTGLSFKMVSNASASFAAPLRPSDLLATEIWNETTGSAVAPVLHCVSDNVTFDEGELWAEADYLGTSGFPLSSPANDHNSNALTASTTDQATSTETWTTTGLGTPVYQKLELSFTPQEKGPYILRPVLAKASSTVYVCPKVA